jgi:metallophosphoesterase (TIGR00282 family)
VSIRIIAIGDVVGGVGLRALLEQLPRLREEFDPDLVVVNAENAASGVGTSPRQVDDLLSAGVDVVTGGNHTLHRRELYPTLVNEPRLLRPDNIARTAPGRGTAEVSARGGTRVGIVNVLGSIFIQAAASPFLVIDDLLEGFGPDVRHVLVDIHAEATSEKIALARYLDGRVTAVVGTHTHVQTADARVFSGGTGFVTDLGMTGPHDSVIGVRSQIVIERFLKANSGRFEPAEDEVLVQGAVIDADESGHATAIQTFSKALD